MPSPLDLIKVGSARLEDSDAFFGHGTDNATDEATFLVLHALGLEYDVPQAILGRQCKLAEIEAVETLITRRIEQKIPSAYLTNRMWFAGLEFYVDSRVLVPRSPIAELLLNNFEPWANIDGVKRVLEIGTGSGCIAIALAHYYPHLSVIATDISSDALAVAERNLAKHDSVAQRVEFIKADLFPDLDTKFDMIISNPPYVPRGVVAALPAEYQAEPELALTAGDDGLDLLRVIFQSASGYLNAGGCMVLDVGDRWSVLEMAYPEIPFVWCELLNGGEGVGVVENSSLSALAQTQVK